MPARSNLIVSGGGLLAVALAACATGPVPALNEAEMDYQRAASNPRVVREAPVALHDARVALDRAHEAADEGESGPEIEHLAYLARRRVEIAEEEARRKQALAQQQTSAVEVRAEVAESRAAALAQELEVLRARQTEAGLVVSLDDVLFAVDRADLQPGALPDLARIARFVQEHPERSLRIEGHTDSTGPAEYNLRLSEARAEAVKSVLVRHGVPPDRVDATGFGQSQPVASNATAAGRQQNRRVEIVVADPQTIGSELR